MFKRLQTMNPTENKTLVLQDGFGFLYVPLPFYKRLREAILFVYPALIPGMGYTISLLLGPDIWDTLDVGGRRCAGRYVSYMVRTGELPLRRVGCKHQHPAQYELDT